MTCDVFHHAATLTHFNRDPTSDKDKFASVKMISSTDNVEVFLHQVSLLEIFQSDGKGLKDYPSISY